MKIYFERTGGFAGIKLKAAVESESLPPTHARQLEKLLAGSRSFDLTGKQSASPAAPDRFLYKLTVETESGIRTMEASDAAVPNEMRPLLDYLTRLSRTQRF